MDFIAYYLSQRHCHHMCGGPKHRTCLRSETIGKYDYRVHGPTGDERAKK